ncbi:anthranilate synthase component I family protein [Bacillus xiapuensis]|uniref:anthranilate synthase component I family protein n=1 Tax=Bacillus xiapuensis TaxID=2014075 RepID=UPI001E47E902|nr:anthranilate synthase component I family protein [Bacillus xiapuensis]
MSNRQLFYRTIPFSKERFFQQYKALAAKEAYHVLLESGRGGRLSIAAMSPAAIVQAAETGIMVESNGEAELKQGLPLQELVEWMKAFELPKQEGLPDFQGGAIGYISYDYARCIEKLPEQAADDLGLPLVYFLLFNQWAVFEEDTDKLWLMAVAQNEEEADLASLEKSWTAPLKEKFASVHPKCVKEERRVSFSEETFKQAVEKTKHYISQGDVFQVNLSVRQSCELAVPALSVYEEVRKLNPSPYMAYLHTPDFQVVSASPELLIKKSGTELSTRPIAGTRSRGNSEEEDFRLASELIENEKERAEHVMLVDLERNDLGRVCRYGTVEVNEFMVIEKYSHVQHIVSNVRGEIAEGKTNADVIEAVFPGGTITGAPKVRTMEIIEELEPVRRGIYTGSIGWLGFNGDMELNIVIRTMLVKDQQCHIQAGAGIVVDSNPAHEYKESLKKAAAVWKAKELAERK